MEQLELSPLLMDSHTSTAVLKQHLHRRVGVLAVSVWLGEHPEFSHVQILVDLWGRRKRRIMELPDSWVRTILKADANPDAGVMH